MRVVGLNYSGVSLVAVDRNMYVLARLRELSIRVVICCTRRSRGTPQEKPDDDDGCREKDGRKKSRDFHAHVLSWLR